MTSFDEARRPRYLHVRQRVAERIQSGAWAPGQLIPSEYDIAREFGVSQGTARMAVATLATEGVVVRKQGLGTYVFEHTREEELARFSSVFDASRERISADSRSWRPVEARASPSERRELKLPMGAKVLRVRRLKTRNGSPFALERITLPEALFRGLARHQQLPAALYELYQKSCGVLVVKVEERLTAVSADGAAARALGVKAGVPLLRIERVAFDLDDRPVEWRLSLCYLADAHYLARLR